VLPYVDADHWPQVTFLGQQDEWCKVAGKYKYLYEMDTETAYNWLCSRPVGSLQAVKVGSMTCLVEATSIGVCERVNNECES
jgi:hypothetical protein